MITSINVSAIPFASSTDSTRFQMGSKQIQQSIPHLNCDVPYAICEDYRCITEDSKVAIKIAEKNGIVYYKNEDLMIVKYEDDTLETFETPPIRKTSVCYATELRFSLNTGDVFKKGDIIYNYSEFTDYIPSYGYNVMTAYMPFFGFNHEDGIVISESFANRARIKEIDRVFVPIYDFTILQKIYTDEENSLLYFPNVGQKTKGEVLCSYLMPRNNEGIGAFNKKDIRNKFLILLKNISISELINLNQNVNNFITNKIKTALYDGTINGIRIHKVKKECKLLDKNLQDTLEYLYSQYSDYVKNYYKELVPLVGREYAIELMRKYYVYMDKTAERGNLDLRDICYIVEFEIVKEEPSFVGDKFCNSYAAKGVVSLILPDELRPIAKMSNAPIDFIYNPFGVFSRMNLGQLPNVMVSKNVMMCDYHIKTHPEETLEVLSWLNENIISNISMPEYYSEVNNMIEVFKQDKEALNQFINNVKHGNLFIECPSFSRINLKALKKNSVPTNEPVIIPKATLRYMKQKLGAKIEINDDKDLIIPDIFVGPAYIQKLYKLVKHLRNARDIGSVKAITKQPVKSRRLNGGSRIGQMEVEAFVSHGTIKALKELTTVKSDWTDGKYQLINELIEKGEYHMPESVDMSGRTKVVVDKLLTFLKE